MTSTNATSPSSVTSHTPEPRHHRYAVGSAEMIVAAEGIRRFPLPDGFVINADRTQINAALAAAGMPPDEMTIHFNPVVVRLDSRLVLIDTGLGPDAAKQPGSTAGLLVQSLATAGISPEQIDTVVISHFHGDHVGGLRTRDGERVFPKADIRVPAPEWAYWMDDSEMAKAPAGRIADLFTSNRAIFEPIRDHVSTYEWDSEIFPGLKAVATPGHSPGHTSFILSSGGERVFIQSDVTNHPALFARNPGWHAAFDHFPEEAEATRRRVYEMLVAEHLHVQGFHIPFPSHGYAVKDGDGYRIEPA